MAIDQLALRECNDKIQEYGRLKRTQQEKKEKYENLRKKIEPQLTCAIEGCRDSLETANEKITNRALVIGSQTVGTDKIEDTISTLDTIDANLEGAIEEIKGKIEECEKNIQSYQNKYDWWIEERERVRMGR